MATLYWYGGTGTWDLTSTTNWSNNSGNSPASPASAAPTSADDVVFDVNSNTGNSAFTVTIGAAGAVCKNFSTSSLDGTMTLAGSGAWSVYGNLTFPATSFTRTYNGALTFAATTSVTITTNGVAFGGTVLINGVGGTFTLGSALSTSGNLTLYNGTFTTSASNYSITAASIANQAGTKTLTLNGSAVSLTGTTPINLNIAPTGFTLNAGTSTITCSGATCTLNTNGYTYNNIIFSSTVLSSATFGQGATIANLTFTAAAASRISTISISSAGITVTGTLSIASGNTDPTRRYYIYSSTFGTQRTITISNTPTLVDVDFTDIAFAGTATLPVTGTRLGDAGGNSNITFPATKTVYWNLTGSVNWHSTGWAATSGTSPAAANFPLPQDTAIFNEAGAASTVAMSIAYNYPAIDCSARTSTAMTLNYSVTANWLGNVTLSSVVTVSGSGTINAYKRGTQNFNIAGATFSSTIPLVVGNVGGSFVCGSSFTVANITHSFGTLDLSGNYTLTASYYSRAVTNTCGINFGTSGKLSLTGNATTVFFNTSNTGITISGTPRVDLTYSGSTGTRTINHAGAAANAISFYVTAGSDTLTLGNPAYYGLDTVLTGFSGSVAIGTTCNMYGSLRVPATVTSFSSANLMFFATANSTNTKTITTNGVTIDCPVTINCTNDTVQLGSALTLGSTRTLTFTSGTLNANSQNLTTGTFASSGTGTRTLTLSDKTWTITGSGSTAWNIVATNLTVSASTAIIDMTSASAKTFAGAGLSWPTLRQGGTGTLAITGANTFTNITNTAQPATISFPASTTTTVSSFDVSGTAGNLITLNSSTAGTRATISDSSGTTIVSYCSITDIAATGGGIWQAYTDNGNVDGGNNTGWVFSLATLGSFLAFFF